MGLKAVLIVHNAAIWSEVEQIFQSMGVNCYSKFTNVLGRGELSEPHMDTDVWPGINTGTLVVTESDKAKKLLEAVRGLRKRLSSEGIKGFMWEIEEVT